MKLLSFILFPLIVFSLYACFEKDEAVEPYPGEVVLIDQNIIDYYSYFDFETEKIVKTHPVSDWQLAFESQSAGWHIMSNSGDNWFVWNTGATTFNSAPEPSEDSNWEYDRQHAYPDSTAVGNWVIPSEMGNSYTNEIYYLGKESGRDFIEQKQLQFIKVDSFSYTFCYKNSAGGIIDTITIEKLDSVNFVFFDFNLNQQINMEPDRDSYDIIFCPYYAIANYFGVTRPYLVRGVFLNANRITAAFDSINTYNQIDYESLDQYNFTPQRDLIGYTWKDPNVNTANVSANYTIRHHYNYIVHTPEGNYYKMRFLSFNLNGSSGYPQFEYKLLSPVQ